MPLLFTRLLVVVAGCCEATPAFAELGDPEFRLSAAPPRPRELGLDPSLCPAPWDCGTAGAGLDVCPAKGLPWLEFDSPWLGLGVVVWHGLEEKDEWGGYWAAAETAADGRNAPGHSRDPRLPGAPWEPYRPIGAGGEEVGDKSHWSRVRTMRTASCLSWVRCVAQTSQRLSRSFHARRELLGTWSLSWRRSENEGS